MSFGTISKQLNLFVQCKGYGTSLWQCPQFIFLVLGLFIITSTLTAYAVGAQYIQDPLTVVLTVFFITGILLIIAFIITKSFEKVAEANRMKSEFISIVSHQLRSPLSNLKWALELLMSGRLGPIEEKQIEYFKILKENSGRMISLVSDLLIVSRIDTAALRLEKKSFSLENLISDLIKEFNIFIKASNAEIKFVSPTNLPEVYADAKQVRQVLGNLLDNAIRYLSPRQEGDGGGLSENISREKLVEIKLEQKGGNIYFEIRDTGVGIPKEDQKYIFQKFFRSRNALKSQTEGSGLGLYIAKAIIEKSGGIMGFRSKEGVGSTFWFTLPTK